MSLPGNTLAGSSTAPPPIAKPRANDTVRGPLGYGRETIESIVVAFTLALLFRTFEAEAFVIPTGSMATTLMGRHKDLECEACGRGYQVGASREEDDQSQAWRQELIRVERTVSELRAAVADTSRNDASRAAAQRKLATIEAPRGPLDQLRTRLEQKMVSTARCPNCGYETDLLVRDGDEVTYDWRYPSFHGDRILVSKTAYDLADPERFDVVVFKYPEDAKVNYIKRLVGLPGETISIIDGDLWVSTAGEPEQIIRKEPEKLLAMLQEVHDSHHLPEALHAAGWPQRWADWKSGSGPGWASEDGGRSYAVACPEGRSATLRYRHFLPDGDVWEAVKAGRDVSGMAEARLIDDFEAYNSIRTRSHWVGDLAIEVDLQTESNQGEVAFELVEGGLAYRCVIDLISGEATLTIPLQAGDPTPHDGTPRGPTPIRGAGRWQVLFANVDDELSLFVDGKRIAFDRLCTFVRQEDPVQPITTPREPGNVVAGDLAPVGITSSGATVTVHQLRVLRDLFYIGAYDLGRRPGELLEDSRIDYELGPDQFLMLGDNSAASKDSRLWTEGHHVDRSLLIGKALVIFWPHPWPASWSIPLRFGGSELRLPFWPNFGRMRRIR
jgi:signal peptidase I